MNEKQPNFTLLDLIKKLQKQLLITGIVCIIVFIGTYIKASSRPPIFMVKGTLRIPKILEDPDSTYEDIVTDILQQQYKDVCVKVEVEAYSQSERTGNIKISCYTTDTDTSINRIKNLTNDINNYITIKKQVSSYQNYYKNIITQYDNHTDILNKKINNLTELVNYINLLKVKQEAENNLYYKSEFRWIQEPYSNNQDQNLNPLILSTLVALFAFSAIIFLTILFSNIDLENE